MLQVQGKSTYFVKPPWYIVMTRMTMENLRTDAKGNKMIIEMLPSHTLEPSQ